MDEKGEIFVKFQKQVVACSAHHVSPAFQSLMFGLGSAAFSLAADLVICYFWIL